MIFKENIKYLATITLKDIIDMSKMKDYEIDDKDLKWVKDKGK